MADHEIEMTNGDMAFDEARIRLLAVLSERLADSPERAGLRAQCDGLRGPALPSDSVPDLARLVTDTAGVPDIDDLKREFVVLLTGVSASQVHLETGLRAVACLCPQAVFRLNCDFVHGYAPVFGSVFGTDEGIGGMLGDAERLDKGEVTREQFDRTAASTIEKVAGAIETLHTPGCWIASALRVFAAYTGEWRERFRQDDGTWDKPWWWPAVDISRLTANGSEELATLMGLEGETAHLSTHAFNDECIRQRLSHCLLDWLRQETGLPPARDRCGSAEAAEWMRDHGFKPTTRDSNPTYFELRLGDVCLSKQGRRRTIEGYGVSEKLGPVYIVRIHESGQLDRKRLNRPDGSSVGYGPPIARDESVIGTLVVAED